MQFQFLYFFVFQEMQTHRERHPAVAIIVGAARDISPLSSLTDGLNLYFRLVKKKKKTRLTMKTGPVQPVHRF